MPRTVISYVFSDSPNTAESPAGVLVERPGRESVLAENVVAGDEICINFLKATVSEVGSTVINDDGTKEPRTVISGGA